jgi:hypothetical protein
MNYDITFCSGEKEEFKCPLREKCHRYVKNYPEIKDRLISQFIIIPYDLHRKECKDFWEEK